MKKISIIFMVFMLLIGTTNVYAADVQTQTRTKVDITATVPEDFSDSIRVALTNSDTGEEFYKELTKAEEYKGSISVVGNVKYNITIIFNNQQNYSILGIKDSYFINGAAWSLSFNVVKNGKNEKTTYFNNGTNTNTLGEEETTKNTNITSTNTNSNEVLSDKEIVDLYTNAIEKIKVYYDNRDKSPYIKQMFEGKHSISENEGVIQAFCNYFNIDSIEGKNISSVDIVAFYFLGNEVLFAERYLPDKQKFMNQLEMLEINFYIFTDDYGTREITDSTYQAIYKVWEGLYDYYVQTGKLYNFYENDNIPYVKDLKSRLNIEISQNTEIETNEIDEKNTEVESTLGEEETTKKISQKDTNKTNSSSAWDRTLEGLKKNAISLLILLITGVALVVLYIKKKKSKKNEID